MTVCTDSTDAVADYRRRGISTPNNMAIMTRHALEAFPSVEAQCVGARCPLMKPSRPLLEVDSARFQHRAQTISTSPLKKRSTTHGGSFEKKGQTWVAATELQSDLLVEVADMSFHLHKFPLLSRSGRLNRLVFESRDTEKDHIKMDDMPGGPGAFELAAKFCYGIPITITPAKVAALRCAAEYLEMTEDLEEGNLVSKTDNFLSSDVLASWKDSITVLQTCERLSPWAEKLHIVKMCSESIAWKACTDPRGIRWSYSSAGESPSPPSKWNGLAKNFAASKHIPQDWWFADVAVLNLQNFTKVMDAIKAKGMRSDLMGSAIFYYAHKWLPGLSRDTFSSLLEHRGSPGSTAGSPRLIKSGSPTRDRRKKLSPSQRSDSFKRDSGPPPAAGSAPPGAAGLIPRDASGDITALQSKHKEILEGIVGMLPAPKDSVSVSAVLRLLRLASMLNVGAACKKELEKRAGMQLDQAALGDLLIPSFAHTSDTLYDVDVVHRCLENFLVQDHVRTTNPREAPTSSGRDKNGDIYDGSFLRPPVAPHTAKMKVAKLMDSYLSEVARDSKLPFAKFQALAEALPEFSRLTDDGLYRAIDTYLKAHPGLTEQERKKLCRMMDCQRLSLEACMHAAQNERLPLRIVVQVLFSEQLKLRNALTGTALVRDVHAPESPLPHRSPAGGPHQPAATAASSAGRAPPLHETASTQMDIRALQQDVMFMKARFAELQKDYSAITQQVEKLSKQKGHPMSWAHGFRRLFQPKEPMDGTPSPSHPRWSRHTWRNSIT